MLGYAVALLVFAVAKDEEINAFTGYDFYWGFFLGKLLNISKIIISVLEYDLLENFLLKLIRWEFYRNGTRIQ